MAYAYWKSGKTKDHAVFDLFFRKNPFQGEFTIFAGLEECLKFLNKFHYSDSDIDYLRNTLPANTEEEFFEYLRSVNASDIRLYAMAEGYVAFPRLPLMRIEGPLIIVQLLETTLLTLVNYASLMATNAARYRIAAGSMKLFEFGLRRAQGPDGGLSASKYAYMGGFDGTSNVLAGKLFNIPVKGTHAHAYITSFNDFSELRNTYLEPRVGGKPKDLLQLTLNWRNKILPLFNFTSIEASEGELAALVSFAIAFPDGFMALVDTYEVQRYSRQKNTNITMHNECRSGLLNFCAVALALNDLGYRAIGIRLDSGDLAYLSTVARRHFTDISIKYNLPWFETMLIMASNDINEETILSLNEQGHKINCFGIGTHLVTCQKQPALGCVYKMVELNGYPRMKLSQDVGKVTMPGRKDPYRLYSETGDALVDLILRSSEKPPQMNEKVLCRHPFEESKRAYVTPSKVEKLLTLYWEMEKSARSCQTSSKLKKG
nr:unnamed protein product [Callosobruchus analis]